MSKNDYLLSTLLAILAGVSLLTLPYKSLQQLSSILFLIAILNVVKMIKLFD